MRDRAVPAAEIVTPNLFELEFLTGRSINSLADLKAAIATLHAMGPQQVLVTSLITAETPDDALDLVASSPAGLFRLRTPRLQANVNGLGDAIAALFLVHSLREQNPAHALQAAGSSVYGLLRQTVEAGSREILTIAAQEEFAGPGSFGPMKAAMTAYASNLSQSLAPKGIRVNIVSPGPVFFEGGNWDTIKTHMTAFYDATVAKMPLKRLGDPREIANAIAFLASPAASLITGANLVIDGGYTKRIKF
jgi:NAD(P)-dependent dehydrogenase (short-subunit alcohol dehydrogenase family)